MHMYAHVCACTCVCVLRWCRIEQDRRMNEAGVPTKSILQCFFTVGSGSGVGEAL